MIREEIYNKGSNQRRLPGTTCTPYMIFTCKNIREGKK